jgi:hypothetical protein
MLCKHIYENINKEVCPDCGGYTHEVNWNYQAELMKQWKIDNPNVKYSGWWSI